MKEFQEEILFQGAAQSQGFAPSQAPDVSRFLRENMAQFDRNLANVQNTQQANLDAKYQKQIKTLEMFGQFSTTAMEFAKTMGKAYIDSQIIEGQNKARSLGRSLNYGVSAEQEQLFNQTLQEEKENQAVAANAALDLGKQNASVEAINYIKSLPQYQRIGAYRTYFKNKGKLFGDYLKQFVQRTDIKLPKPDGSGTFTPQQINNDPGLMQIALSHASRLFMAEEVGMGSENNPTALAAKPLYEEMDKAEDAFMIVVRRNKAINDSEGMVYQATETFKANGDFNAYLSALTGSLDEEGNMRNRSEALDYALDSVVARYAAGETEILQVLDQTVDGDPKGKTFRQRFENRMLGSQGIDARIEAIDRKNRAKIDEDEADDLKLRRRTFEAASRQRAAEGRPFTDQEIDVMREEAMAETGKAAEYFPWFSNYQTVEEKDAEQEAELLDDIRRRRGYLIEADLRDKSSATYKAYISIVQDDKSIAELPKSYTTDANKLINALTNDKFKEEIGVADKTPEWEDMARRARDKYPSYIQEEIRAGNPPALAQKNALQRLRENFAAGTYTRDPEMTADLEYLKTLRTARLTMAENPKIDEYVFNGTENDLKRLVDYNQGTGEIPKFYYDMAMGQKNLTAWDIAAAQYRAAGYGELGAHGKKAQYDRLDPAVQNVLNYKPTPNKIKRAQATSFKPQATVVGASGYRGSTDVEDTGLKDYKNRPIRMAPPAAQQWKAMIKAGMPFNSADVSNVYRDEKEYLRLKSEGYNPSSGGLHNFGLAIDVHGPTGEWLRQNGAAFGWFPHDYEGTHGGHYEFRGIKQ